MKQVTSILLIIIFCFSVVRPVISCFEYIINYDYITKVLCINKEKPELKCSGKCYLKEQLSKISSENKSKEKRIPKIKFEKFPIICYQTNDFLIKKIDFNTNSDIWGYNFSINNSSSKPPTPPPKC